MLKLKRAKLGRLARRDLYAFSQFISPDDYVFNWHHRLLYRELDAFAAGQTPRLLIQAPPGHGKSEGVSRNLPAYLMGRNPDARLICCSYTGDLASDMNRDVQRIIDSTDYRELFPETRLAGGFEEREGSRRKADLFDIVGHRGYYKSAGVGGGIVGRRFDFGVIDDPVKDRETANSSTQREAAWRWYTGVFTTRAARNAAICLTLTRWHDDDLAGRILKSEGDRWKVVTLPAIAKATKSHPDDPRQPGEALWPWFKSVADLEQQRELDRRDFAALYQQEPTAEGGAEFPSEWFSPGIYFDDWPTDCFVKALALDPSKGKDAKFGDYSAFVLAGRTPDGTTWIEADLERRPTPRIVEDGLYLYEQWRPDGFAVEINSFQELLAAEFARVAGERKPAVVLPLYAITNRLPKATRIRSIGPRLAQRKLRFRGGHHGTRLLVEQLMQFPNGDYDDGCFVAGTMIETASGPKPIETVRAGDMVLTRTGFARVTVAGCTGIKPVIEVAASNGKRLIGTGNHPVFDGSAFVPMRSACTLWRCQKPTIENYRASLSWSSSTGSISGATLMRNSGPTASISPLTPGIVGQALGRFIRKCGSRFTGRYPTASRFITPTMIRSTTPSRTLSASLKRNTTGGTQLLEANGQRAQQAELVWRKPGSPRHDGTDRKPVEYGTESLGFGHGKAGSQLKCVARTAARLTRHSLPAGLSFAPPAAGSGPTRPMVALRAASVVGRSSAGFAAVYNLTVEGQAEYFANGFLVHNCDALEMALRLLDELLGERERNAAGPGRPQIWRAA